MKPARAGGVFSMLYSMYKAGPFCLIEYIVSKYHIVGMVVHH
jgi:hypothetical protein